MAGNDNSARAGAGSGNSRSAKKRKNRANRRSAGGGDAPSAVGTGNIAQGPAVVGSIGQTVRFRNTEYVGDIVASSTGSTSPVLAVNVNPSNPGFTGWLSRIAAGYELYRFRSLSFTYTPMCSSSVGGIVVMAVDYDATDAPPPNKASISAYEGATRGNAWSKMVLRAKPMAGWYYTNLLGSANPAGTDQKMYDMGAFYVGAYGAPTGASLGEVSVSYEVEFAKPDYVATSLAEAVVPSGSVLSSLAGTSVATLGATLFTVQSVSSGVADIIARVPGDYLIQLVGGWGGGATPTNVYQTPMQTDPGGQPATLSWTDAFVNAAAGSYLNDIIVTVQVGSAIRITATASLLALTIVRMRVFPYRKLLG